MALNIRFKIIAHLIVNRFYISMYKNIYFKRHHNNCVSVATKLLL